MRNHFSSVKTKTARPWQPRWWQEDPERWRWAGAITIVVVLIGVFTYTNPQVWQNQVPMQLAEEETPLELVTPSIPEPLEAEPSPPAEETVPAAASQAEPEGPEDEVVAVSTAPASWQQPAYGVWARSYGYALDPTYNDYRFHRGRDMALDAGSPVFAAASGKVTSAAKDALWGGIVVIEHGGGWQSVYKGLDPQVKPSAEITAGEQLGVALPAPPAEKAQESHVHFELLLNGENVDPETVLF